MTAKKKKDKVVAADEKLNSKKAESSETQKSDKKQKSDSRGKKFLKISAWVISSLLAVILLLIIFRDPVIKFGVTSVGSWLTGVDVSLDSIDTSLDGAVNLKGLRLGNPDGYTHPNMLDLEEFNLKVDVSSLTSQEIVIENLEVKNLLFTAEFDRKSNFNVTTLVNNLNERFAPKTDDAAKKESKENLPDDQEDAEDAASPKKAVLFRNLAVAVKLNLVHDLSGAELTAPISYSTTDLKIADDSGEHWTKKMASAAAEFESWCKACFNAGEFIITAGMEAFSGVSDVLKKGFNSGKQVLDKGKDLFNSATSIFKK